MKPSRRKYMAAALSALLLFQSCAIYQGDYSLDKAVAKEKKVEVKFCYQDYLMYEGFSYRYDRTNDHEFWTLIQPLKPSKKQKESLESENSPFSDIYRKDNAYYGVTDPTDHNTWVRIDTSNIKMATITEKQVYKKIVYQEGHYFGVIKDDLGMDLVLIYEDEVEKVSYYSPALSVLCSILTAPVMVILILFTPIEDYW